MGRRDCGPRGCSGRRNNNGLAAARGSRSRSFCSRRPCADPLGPLRSLQPHYGSAWFCFSRLGQCLVLESQDQRQNRSAGIAATLMQASSPSIRLGLRENWQQFSLLVLVNAFVGGMVGLERTVVPLIGSQEFKIASTTVVVSFIVSFGVIKALANLVSGQFADTYGRKHVLIAGWLFGLPLPFMIAWAPTWGWVVAANALLGINQGLAWSMTVIMKIDLVGPKSRGLAVGLNEFAGYLSVGVTAFLTGYLAEQFGLRPQPFYLGIGYAALGFILSLFLVHDTRRHVGLEIARHAKAAAPVGFREIFLRTSFGDRNLFAASQAGLVNNLNDGMSWGIFPLFFASHGLSVERIGLLKRSEEH